MRNVLFRGKCVGDDDVYGWVDGYYVCLRDSYKKRESHRIYTGFAECDCGNFYGDWYEVDPETVGQFTGLTDKNGNRIFEGDILVRHITPMIVTYSEESASFIVKYNIDNRPFTNTLDGHDYLKVVGNIHDNPELMEKDTFL